MTVAIIGAGPAGLVAAKTALECGLHPTVLEKSDRIGGLWKPGTGFVWDSMHTNLSYHSCMFSDAPWDNPSGDFPTQKEVYNYLELYASKNGIFNYTHFNSEVQKVSKASGQWRVEWLENKDIIQKDFDYVMVCSGIFSKAHVPSIPGLETFTGQVIHSRDYKNPDCFQGKKVVVVGNAFSGTEIAAELSTVTAQTLHCISKAMWVLPRYVPDSSSVKQPLDLVFFSRVATEALKKLPEEEENRQTHQWFQHLTKQNEVAKELIVTTPEEPQFSAISDTYIDQVKVSKIDLKQAKIIRVFQNTIFFNDGTQTDADALIFATGYEAELPFFDAEILQKLDFCPQDRFQPLLLDKCTFNPDLPNMAFCGMQRGPYFCTMELQARLAFHVFTNRVKAPSLSQMNAGIEIERKIRIQTPRPQFPHGNYVEFSDMLAKEAGVLPDLEGLKESNTDLYKLLHEGPFNASHYRLNGPFSNPEESVKYMRKMHLSLKSKNLRNL